MRFCCTISWCARRSVSAAVLSGMGSRSLSSVSSALEAEEAFMTALGCISDALIKDELVHVVPSASLASSSSHSSERERTEALGVGEEVDAEHYMDILLNSTVESGEPPLANTVTTTTTLGAPPPAPATPPLPRGLSAVVSAAPEKQLAWLLQYSPQSAAQQAALELMLEGADFKALLVDGTLRGMHLKQRSLRRCDFTGVSFQSLQADQCDFSRSVFYSGRFHNCTFHRCTFDGALLKRVHCTGNVEFNDCSFRHGVLALQHPSWRPEKQKGAGRPNGAHTVVFRRCNFDLSDFEGTRLLNVSSAFISCSNTETAANFPLRRPSA